MKAAFTRAYNKEAHLTPYSLQVVKTSRLSTGPALDSEYSEEFQEDDTQSEKEQDAVETDAMIKVVHSAVGRVPLLLCKVPCENKACSAGSMVSWKYNYVLLILIEGDGIGFIFYKVKLWPS